MPTGCWFLWVGTMVTTAQHNVNSLLAQCFAAGIARLPDRQGEVAFVLDQVDVFYRELGRRLATARLAVRPKMSTRELGDRLGVTGSAITKWEKGQSPPPPAQIRAAARELGVTVAWLYGEEELAEDSQFAHLYHRLSPQSRSVAMTVMRTLQEHEDAEQRALAEAHTARRRRSKAG